METPVDPINFNSTMELTILKLGPAQRSQKQQDRLINHFVKWYSYAISKEKGKELKLEELAEKLQKLDEEYPELTEVQTVAESKGR